MFLFLKNLFILQVIMLKPLLPSFELTIIFNICLFGLLLFSLTKTGTESSFLPQRLIQQLLATKRTFAFYQL